MTDVSAHISACTDNQAVFQIKSVTRQATKGVVDNGGIRFFKIDSL